MNKGWRSASVSCRFKLDVTIGRYKYALSVIKPSQSIIDDDERIQSIGLTKKQNDVALPRKTQRVPTEGVRLEMQFARDDDQDESSNDGY